MRRPTIEPDHDAIDLLFWCSGVRAEPQDIRKAQTQNSSHPELDKIPAWHARAIRDQLPHVFLDELNRTGLQLQMLRSRLIKASGGASVLASRYPPTAEAREYARPTALICEITGSATSRPPLLRAPQVCAPQRIR